MLFGLSRENVKRFNERLSIDAKYEKMLVTECCSHSSVYKMVCSINYDTEKVDVYNILHF